MAKHRAVSDRARWRRALAPTGIPAPRRLGIELVDARTRLAHRVSSEALLAGRQSGDYEALCGARLLSASLTDPGHCRCLKCAQ